LFEQSFLTHASQTTRYNLKRTFSRPTNSNFLTRVNNTDNNVNPYKCDDSTQTITTNKSSKNNTLHTNLPSGRIHPTKRSNNRQSKERKCRSMRVNVSAFEHQFLLHLPRLHNQFKHSLLTSMKKEETNSHRRIPVEANYHIRWFTTNWRSSQHCRPNDQQCELRSLHQNSWPEPSTLCLAEPRIHGTKQAQSVAIHQRRKSSLIG